MVAIVESLPVARPPQVDAQLNGSPRALQDRLLPSKEIAWTWVPEEEFFRDPTPPAVVNLQAFGLEKVHTWGPITFAEDNCFVRNGVPYQKVRSLLPLREPSKFPLIAAELDVPVGMVEWYLDGGLPWPTFEQDLLATGHYHNDRRAYRNMGTAPINKDEAFWGFACSVTKDDPHVALPLYREDHGVLRWTGQLWCPNYLWTAYRKKSEVIIVAQGCGDIQQWGGENVRMHPPRVTRI